MYDGLQCRRPTKHMQLGESGGIPLTSFPLFRGLKQTICFLTSCWKHMYNSIMSSMHARTCRWYNNCMLYRL
jgi:hypothetical protein